jgi:hypothetical protein
VAHAFVKPGRQPAVACRADHDQGCPNGVGVLGDYPAGRAMVSSVQEDLPLASHLVRGQLIEAAADQRPGGGQVLAVDGDVAPHGRLPGVHDVHGQAVLRGQPCRCLCHQAG